MLFSASQNESANCFKQTTIIKCMMVTGTYITCMMQSTSLVYTAANNLTISLA